MSAGLPTERGSTTSSGLSGAVQPGGRFGWLSGFFASRLLRTA